MRLHEYLTINRKALDATVTAATEELLLNGDTDADQRRLAHSLREALTTALRALLENEIAEGHFSGIHGEVAITIYRPPVGKDLFGRLAIQVGRLTIGGTVPCPSDWVAEREQLPEVVEAFIDGIRQPKGGSRILTLDEHGGADLGEALAGRSYLVNDLPGGELWLRPLTGPSDGD